jgi:NUMOD4 motif
MISGVGLVGPVLLNFRYLGTEVRVTPFTGSGVGMVGPIQLKLRYQGITRNVLVEDPVTPGTPVEYDVWDDLGQAYILSGTEGEVRVTPFEGKRIPVRFFRIASRPAIRKEDLFYLRINAVEQAQDETKQAILKQEDARLLVILQAAVTDYATRPDHVVTPNHNITEASGYLTPGSLYSAVAMTDLHELPSARLMINPFDFRDMYEWRDVVGWEGLYQVRGDGMVKSLPRQTRKGVLGGRILKQSPDSSGHLQVTLSRSGMQVKAAVHRLVAAAFIGECPPGKEACHGPLGQQVNWAANLRFDTHASNMADRRRAGRYVNAEKTECPRCGGPYTLRKDGKSRYCAACNNKGTVERRRRNKQAAQ